MSARSHACNCCCHPPPAPGGVTRKEKRRVTRASRHQKASRLGNERAWGKGTGKSQRGLGWKGPERSPRSSHQTRLLKALSSPASHASRDGAAPTSVGDPRRCLATLYKRGAARASAELRNPPLLSAIAYEPPRRHAFHPSAVDRLAPKITAYRRASPSAQGTEVSSQEPEGWLIHTAITHFSL